MASDMEELILAGDHTSWSIDDWSWDYLTFSATPASAEESRGKVCGSSKRLRAREDIQLEQTTCQAGSFEFCQALRPGSVRESTGPLNVSQLSGQEQSFTSAATSTVAGTDLEHSADVAANARRSSSLCQVEGCGRSLRSLSIYHQRCHICEVHIKMHQIEREGKLQRFCQRCGRCHELHAFDKDRRSCRAQLAKHNARRRRRTDQAEEERQPCASPAVCQAASVPFTLGTDYSPLQQPAASLSAAPAPANLTYAPTACASALPAYITAPQLPSSARAAPSSAPHPAAVPSVDAYQMPPATADGQINSFDTAMQLMGHMPNQHGMHAAAAPAGTPYQPATFVSRLSVKLFNCTPHDLPPDLRDQLTSWLHSTPAGAEGYIRAGCVHLTLDILADHDQQATLKQLLQHLAQQPESHLGGRTALLQLGQDLALVKGNQILRSWTVPSPSPFSTAQLLQTGADAPSGAKVQSSECSLQRPSVKRQPVTGSSDAEVHSSADKLRAAEQQQQPGLMPLILDVQPATVTCEPGSSGGPWVQLTGLGLCCEDCQIVCRAGGQHLLVSPEMHAACCTSGSVDSGVVQSLSVQLPNSAAPGLVWLEVQRGALLSPACPLIVLPDAQLAAETQQVLAALANKAYLLLRPGDSGQHAALVDMGLVLRAHFSERENIGLPDDLLAAAASRLLPHVCRNGAAQLLVILLDVVEASSKALAAEILVSCTLESLSVLHHVVTSGSQAAVLALIAWAEQKSFHLQASLPGKQGLTSLHLAAMLPDDGAMATLLTAATDEPPASWFHALTDDGWSPHDFAARAGDSTAADAWFAERSSIGLSQQSLGRMPGPSASTAADLGETAMCLQLSSAHDSVNVVGQLNAPARSELQQQQPQTWAGVLPWASHSPTWLAPPAESQDAAIGLDASWDEEAVALMPVQGRISINRGCSWQSPALLSLWPMGQRPTVATLGVVSCLCTCVVLLRGWAS